MQTQGVLDARPSSASRWLGDASGAVADLGVLLPIAGALVLLNGFDAGTVLVCFGALGVAAGSWFRVPMPVQPIKAAAAIAVAQDLPPQTLAAAGIVLGVSLLAMRVTGLTRLITPLFALPVVRGLQLGVGLLLIKAAFGAQLDVHGMGIAVGMVLAGLLVAASMSARTLPVALVTALGGLSWGIAQHGLPDPAPALWRPELLLGALEPSTLLQAAVLLVLPQIPLTFGNAVIAVSDLQRTYFGARAARVNPDSVSVSCGAANVLTGLLGGVPMCHGAGGLTAHYRAGARSSRMNIMLGSSLLVAGLAFGPGALATLTLLPASVLMAFLLFAGVMHAALVLDQRGAALAVVLPMGLAGLITGNLAIALALGMLVQWAPRLFGVRPPARAQNPAQQALGDPPASHP